MKYSSNIQNIQYEQQIYFITKQIKFSACGIQSLIKTLYMTVQYIRMLQTRYSFLEIRQNNKTYYSEKTTR